MDLNGWRMRTLWAKKSRMAQESKWLPLLAHMTDAAETAALLWQHWLPSGTKRRIARGLKLFGKHAADYDDAALPCFVFLAAAHDIGKAIPAFQGKLGPTELDEQLRTQLTEAGLPLLNYFHPREARHFWASQLILEGAGLPRELAGITGGHHGQPPNIIQLYHLKTSYLTDLGWGRGQEMWREAQQGLLAFALQLAGASGQEARLWKPDFGAQVLLCGLVIMADWIVSNEIIFPYIDLSTSVETLLMRARKAWEELDLPACWNPGHGWRQVGGRLYARRFGFGQPRPIQTALLNIVENVIKPGIVVLEAPMGEGKTEAALAAAEVLAGRTKRSGIFFALPTQASANGLFLRICHWIGRLEDGVEHAVYLAHGKADLNELYGRIKQATEEEGGFWGLGSESEETADDAIIVHEWFSGRKKGILADFVIGTIDQVLMAALKQKHLALRHLGLANKVVILDECHAYDAYMSQYLYKVLNWLGAYGVPVIVLSATLPGDKRKKMLDAYLNRENEQAGQFDPIFDQGKPEIPPLPDWATTLGYPLVTYSTGEKVEQKQVSGEQRTLEVGINVLSADKQIMEELADLLAGGGCAGIIVNTVKRAQEIAFTLKQIYGNEVQLLHSRFLAIDRAQMENDLFAALGADGAKNGRRPKRCIVVGTQIFEQSCDLDFDLLITDICPMDLLIQRIGRLHRHERQRPSRLRNPRCYITGMDDSGFDRGAELIYGKYLLMNTKTLLPATLMIPDDISWMVQEAYWAEGVTRKLPPDIQSEYASAKEMQDQKMARKVAQAKVFQIVEPYRGSGDLVGWLDTDVRDDDPSGKRGEAAVRDTENSLEVLVVQKLGEGYYMLPWLVKYGGYPIPVDQPPPLDLAKAMAQCSIQLPLGLCFKLDQTIAALEEIALRDLSEWQKSHYLRGELFLVLDQQFQTELCGYRLHYDQGYGLFSKKIGEGDGDAGSEI